MAQTQNVLQRSFAGGELTPALAARADTAKYAAGLKTCRNFIVQPHGGVMKRPGTKYIYPVKSAAVQPRFIPFVFKAADQSYLLELGNLYIRFYWHDGIVLSGGVPYEIVSPYAAADVGGIKYSQSADVLTLTHPSYPVYEVARGAHTTWTITAASFVPSLAAPTIGVGTAGTASAKTVKYRYKMTAAKVDTYEESLPSAYVEITGCDPPTRDAPNTIAFTPPSGAAEYYCYGDFDQNGVFGFLGTCTASPFRDAGFTPDPTVTPPVSKTVFAGANDYPSVSTYYQQRALYANTNAKRETVWGSRVGAYHNFNISTPLQDDDGIEFIIASLHLNPVNWLIPLKRLIVFTDEGAFRVMGDDSGTLKPTALNPDQQEYVGSSGGTQPVVVGESILYLDRSERTVRDLTFDYKYNGFAGQDLTIFSTHLFDGYTVVDMAYQQVPHSVLWCVRNDGVLLALTYIKAQEIWAWHQHDVGGIVESVNVLPGHISGADDVVYLEVLRTINGSDVRYVERLAERFLPRITALPDAVYADASLTYSGAATYHLSGLDHLEGQRVAILGDGKVISDGRTGVAYTIVGGAVTPALPVRVSKAVVGLPMPPSDLETLPLDVQGSDVRAKRKRVAAMQALVQQSAPGFKAGPDADHLTTQRAEPWQTATDLMDGPLEANLVGRFTEDGRVFLRHDQPVPFAVLGLIPSVEVGG